VNLLRILNRLLLFLVLAVGALLLATPADASGLIDVLEVTAGDARWASRDPGSLCPPIPRGAP
jgi:hypothetical protein